MMTYLFATREDVIESIMADGGHEIPFISTFKAGGRPKWFLDRRPFPAHSVFLRGSLSTGDEFGVIVFVDDEHTVCAMATCRAVVNRETRYVSATTRLMTLAAEGRVRPLTGPVTEVEICAAAVNSLRAVYNMLRSMRYDAAFPAVIVKMSIEAGPPDSYRSHYVSDSGGMF